MPLVGPLIDLVVAFRHLLDELLENRLGLLVFGLQHHHHALALGAGRIAVAGDDGNAAGELVEEFLLKVDLRTVGVKFQSFKDFIPDSRLADEGVDQSADRVEGVLEVEVDAVVAGHATGNERLRLQIATAGEGEHSRCETQPRLGRPRPAVGPGSVDERAVQDVVATGPEVHKTPQSLDRAEALGLEDRQHFLTPDAPAVVGGRLHRRDVSERLHEPAQLRLQASGGQLAALGDHPIGVDVGQRRGFLTGQSLGDAADYWFVVAGHQQVVLEEVDRVTLRGFSSFLRQIKDRDLHTGDGSLPFLRAAFD